METTAVSYDPFVPGFLADPYPQYERLRAENPISFTKFGFWLLTRYDDVISAYEHPALARNTRLWQGFERWRQGSTDGPLERMMDNWLVLIDPPRHTPLRAIHERVFPRDLADRARPAIDRIVADLLEQPAAAGGMDLIDALADPLPVYVISDLLGIPSEDWPCFRPWSRAIALTSEPLLSPEILQAGARANQEMKDYFRPLIEQRRREPTDDVLSGLANGEHEGQRLTDEELLDSLIFLYQAGHPTTTHLISLGVLSLLRHPDQLERLRRDPSLLPNAVEELDRYDGPVQMNGRVATEDMELLGAPVQKGQLIRLCLASANRDSDHFPDADALDLGRRDVDHLGFGRGLHYCVGDGLGRVMARSALAALLERAPGLQLTTPADQLQWLPSASNRGMAALPVRF